MCIYYTDKTDLNYTSREHIFPAALGGIQMLPLGMVSDEFNNDICGLELDFIRNSIAASPRILVGPGRRGKLGDSHATKSKVHLMKSENGALDIGYVILSKQYIVPHVSLNLSTGEMSIAFNNTEGLDAENKIKELFARFADAAKLRIKYINDQQIPVENILVGIIDKVDPNYNCFVFKNPAQQKEFSVANISALSSAKLVGNLKGESQKEFVRSNLTTMWKQAYYRVIAKIAFNYLAFKLGEQIVTGTIFEPIRQFIIKGGENKFVTHLKEPLDLQEAADIKIGEDSHMLVLFKTAKRLFARVEFYSSSFFLVELTDNYQADFVMDGIIIDWKNKIEKNLLKMVAARFAPSVGS